MTMTWVLRVVLAMLLVYAALLALLWFAQERLLFQPQRLPGEHRFNFGADVHEVWVERPDARLNALHLRLPQPDGVVFYLHGNAGSLESWFVNADFWRKANLDLFMLDYRGYGKSSGSIRSEQQLLDDARAAWAQVAPAYAGKKRIVFGRSLGTGLAAQLAAEVQPDLTVLVSPYESLQALAAEHYAWVPVWLLRYPMRSDLALPRVRTPVVLVHGERDEVIAAQHSRRLLPRAAQGRLLLVPGAGHNDLQDVPRYLQGLREAFTAMR